MKGHELAELDISYIDPQSMIVKVKPTPKRTNRTAFLDPETLEALDWWLSTKEKLTYQDDALFPGTGGPRLEPDSINKVEDHATRIGLHNPYSKQIEDHFTVHRCRHRFTTHLIRAGTPRDFVKELRGDIHHEAIDIYNHIDRKRAEGKLSGAYTTTGHMSVALTLQRGI